MAGLSACSGPPPTDDVVSGELTDAIVQSDVLGAAGLGCAGVLIGSGEVDFRYSGIRATSYLCVTRGDAPSHIIVDEATGEGRTLGDTLAMERDAFTHVHRAVHPVLRAALDAAAPDEWVDAHLWFQLEEDSTAPDVAWNPREEVPAYRKQRIAAAARALVQGIASRSVLRGNVQLSADIEGVDLIAPTIPVRLKRGAADELADLPGLWMAMVDGGRGRLLSEAYFPLALQAYPDNLGYDGDGYTAVIMEGIGEGVGGGRPDSWANLTGAVTGSCAAGGVSKACFCPSGPTGAHARAVGTVIRSAALAADGMADRGKTIFANIDGPASCRGSLGTDNFAAAANWALQNGGAVFNFSIGFNAGSSEMTFMDWVVNAYAVTGVAATGNTDDSYDYFDNYGLNDPYNLLVIGGGRDSGSTNRGDVVMGCGTRAKNHVTGRELPHLVAPCEDVDAAGDTLNEVDPYDGTSFAAPQVAGLALSMMELNPAVRWNPELFFAGAMTGADEDVDQGVGGVWPLSLQDSVDDKDGAGLMNSYDTMWIVAPGAKKDGGNTASNVGHDYGFMVPANQTAGFYNEVYYATVPNNGRLRVTTTFASAPTCGPLSSLCSAPEPFPRSFLWLIDHNGSLVGYSAQSGSNYQYATAPNTSGSAKTYSIRLGVTDWQGLSGGHWAIAWGAE